MIIKFDYLKPLIMNLLPVHRLLKFIMEIENGEEVAIKVQHGYIEKQVVVDLMIYRFISKVYEKCLIFLWYVYEIYI